MSSSVFIESSSKNSDNNDCHNTSDSNLVVVYGKNGISFDDKGLENLLEEKKISTISVIRLTSPTQSMHDEEEDAEKLEEMLKRQEIGSDEDSCDSQDEDKNSFSEDAGESYSSDGDENQERKIFKESDNSSEECKLKPKRLTRRRCRQLIVKQKKINRKHRRERPEIVGLRLEEFYAQEDANEIIKEALKMAGLRSDKKSRSEYEFQLFVIQNDHCYTPFTSPSQMKEKLAADKLQSDKQTANRKFTVLQTSAGRQLFVRRKQHQKISSKTEIVSKPSISTSFFNKEKNILVAHKEKKDIKDQKSISEEDLMKKEEDIRYSFDENEGDPLAEDESDFSGSNCSAETDNDRDSDLDFDVNNPKGRKRKVKLLKTYKRSLIVSKVNPKIKRYYNQDETNDLPNKLNVASTIVPSSPSSLLQRPKSVVKIISDSTRASIRPTPSKIVHMMGKSNVLSPVIAALPPIPKKQTVENKSLLNINNNPTSAALTPKTFVIVKGHVENKSLAIRSPQTHKEIVINKQVMSSPKTKGFTDLTKLIEQTEKQTPVKAVCAPTTPKSSHTATITSVVTFSPMSGMTSSLKGFMPIETAAKSQLPAQISIQTHQSSSELEAEHDKQLDLINSIVQDEMKKTNEKDVEKINNINENIPELVKMLESTEKVLTAKNTQQNLNQLTSRHSNNELNDGGRESKNIDLPLLTPSSSDHNLVGGIDITSASLLATPEGDGNDADDLPDDILQQVVELIKDDKTLQEAVEKQVFGSSVCSEEGITSNMVVNQNPPPLAPISHPPIRIQENSPTSSKSIIQLSISNVPTSMGLSTNPNPVTTTQPTISTTTTTAALGQESFQTSKTSPLARKEPIQIVRGNGRVITLPPIEAPTTRAKRRAQAQPIYNTTSVGNTSFVSTASLSESSLDSSMQSNSSLTAAICSSAATMQDKKSTDTNIRRRGSKETSAVAASSSNQKSSKTQKTVAKKVGSKANANKGKVETEATESEDDDDDPNKLWCICRQPHNNRFMICCDLCEDWFHGTCVSITKAMGLEMEQKGIDWTCPKCAKKQEEKKQPKITEMLIKKTPEIICAQNEPVVISSTLAPTLVSSVPVQKTATAKLATTPLDVNIAHKEFPIQNLETTSHLKLQSGKVINLKDLVTTGAKKTNIIQTSTSSTNTLTAGQKKLFVTSGQANLKLTSHPGRPIRTITVVKQIMPQQQGNQNIKVIKAFTSAASLPSQSINVNTISAADTTTALVSTSSSILRSTANSTLCIVCKKIARSNSIYCSDDCIRKHAQNALNTLMTKSLTDTSNTMAPLNKNATEDKTKRKSKGLFEELLSAADRKPKVERVNVYERKSGRVFTGNSAPTVTNLKKWLQDNPTFEVIQPGSTQAMDLEKKQKVRTQHSSSPTVPKSVVSSPPPLKMFSITSGVPTNKAELGVGCSQSLQIQAKTHKAITDYLKGGNSHPPSPRPITPKQLQKYPPQVTIKPDKVTKTPEDSKSVAKDKLLTPKRQASTESSNKSSNSDGEPIRLVVRRTLKEQLLLRIKEETTSMTTSDSEELIMKNVPKLTEEEIEEFVKSTELEMYNYFNKDTGIKYKAKYRSLVFNIKDRKNKSLFAKICCKLILPKQLVRMSPEEMASQELAQWREQENKHQLEMIKKSELDLLSCAKNYVLKTHKGEEVIEGKSSDYVNVDITIPVEDVVSAINKSDAAASNVLMRSELLTQCPDADTTFLSHSLIDEEKSISGASSHCKENDKEREREKEKEPEKDKEKQKEKDKERTRSRDKDREKRHKSKDRHHDKFRSRKRSRSHSRSRSREKGEKRHKSSHKDEKRDREERIRADKESVRDRSEREHHSDINEKKSETKKPTVAQVKTPGKKQQELPKSTTNPMHTYNLIDQILESSKTVEEAANLISDRNKEKEAESSRRNVVTPQPATSTVSSCSSSADSATVVDIPSNLGSADSDQEPTSTVSIPTPPHDPYSRFIVCSSPSASFSGIVQYNITSLWTGHIDMVDVTSFRLSLQPIVGNSTGLGKLLPTELDVVGRIGPETVWDYISKIKKSPNKEIVILRLIPASESETVAYKVLYEYLDNRNRLGVIKSTSSQIKDFYIYPLGAGKNIPSQLQATEPVDFYDDSSRPDVLIGIIIRVTVMKRIVQNLSQSVQVTTSTSAATKLSSRSNDMDNFTPPGSPKSKKRRQSITTQKVGDIDIDAIIKAPIVAKTQKTVGSASITKLSENEADEPYSPGGSSDDDLSLLPVQMIAGLEHNVAPEDELKRKMEEINRQIAAQEMEIAGLLTGEPSTYSSATASTSNVLAGISIPSNLSQILASIKTSGKDLSLVPTPPPPLIGSLQKPSTPVCTKLQDTLIDYKSESTLESAYNTNDISTKSNTNSTSLLAKLSEAELLSMVPDDIVIAPSKATRYEEPPPPGV